MGIGPRILVPVDFSRSSKRALGYAATLCGELGATLHVVHVVEPDGGIPLETAVTAPNVPPRTLGDLARADARRRLSTFVAQAALGSIVPVEFRVEVGSAHELIA